MDKKELQKSIVVDTEMNIKNEDGTFTTVHPITKESNLVTEEGNLPLRECKFDDVETYVDEEKEVNVMDFYANGNKVKTIEFVGGGGGPKGGTISTSLPPRFSIREGESVVIPYVFDSPNKGTASLFVQVICGEKSKELEYEIKRVGAGSVNIGAVDKGINEITIYAIDFLGQMTNTVTFTVVCGSIEIKSTFDDNQDFNSYAAIAIPFDLSSLDKTATMVLNVNIDGINYTQQAYEGYNSFTFPAEMKITGVHRTTLQVTTDDFQSNILEYNVIIVDSSEILVSTKNSSMTIEEGNDLSIDYRISTIGQNMFISKLFVNGNLVREQNAVLGMNNFTIGYEAIPVGNYDIRIEASTIDDALKGSLSMALKVVPNSFKRIEFVKPGLQAWFNMARKSNSDKDRDVLESEVLTDSGRRARIRLHDYNYSTNGWINGRLVNNGISWAEVENYLPLEDNVPNGFTFDIQFKSFNAGDNDAKVVSCVADDTPYQGLFIDSEKAVITTEANKLKTFYTDQADMRVTFVVHRTSTYIDKEGIRQKNPMVQTYINGMFTEVAMLSDTGSGGNLVLESIMHGNSILINTDKMKDMFGNNEIKSILIYNRPLEHEEVLQNLMADIDNLVEQKRKYDANYVTINQDIPTMYFNDTEIGNHDTMTKDTKQWINVVYSSPDKDKFGPSFDFVCQTAWQGTSSLAYPVKNYKFKMYDYVRDEEGNIDPDKKNDPKSYIKKKLDMFSARDGNGYAEQTYCLKADYMDSSHCRNTGTARLVNDFLFDGNPNPAKKIDPKTRDTINGFPIQLYVNGKWSGIYNFNHDKSCSSTLGMKTIEHTVRWEIKANSDSSEGAFHITWDKNDVNDIYKKILTDFEIAFDEDAFEDQTGEYDVTKYYDDIGIPHDGPVMGTYYDYAILSLARFVNFVGNTEDPEVFRANAHKYFNVEQACRYYLNVMTMGMIDNFAKNCIINMYGDDIWWFNFYDMDSSLGLDNTGYNKFETDIEPSQPNIYNCSTSKMWVKLNDWLQDDIFNTFKKIREGKYTYENLTKYLIETQIDIIPEVAYNRDMYAKYISQGRQYLHMLHGNNKDHLIRWLYNRFQYVDSLFLQQNSPYTKQNLTIRSNKPTWVPEGQNYVARFEIETYCPQYVTVAWRKNTYETIRVGFNETVVFEREMVNSTDNELILYCAGNLKRIGDCTNLRPTSIDIGTATRLVEFKCENSDVLLKADLSKNTYLREVSFKGCSRLGDTTGGANILDVSKCTNLRKVDVRGTKITAVLSNVDGGNLESIKYSDVTQSIVLSRQTNMRLVGIPYGYENVWSGIDDVVIDKGYKVDYLENVGLVKTDHTLYYTVLKKDKHDNGEISLNNLWELEKGPMEILFPVNGTTVMMHFFDADKNYSGSYDYQDNNKHDSLSVVKLNPPASARYAIISVMFERPMTLDNNIEKFAIVAEGNREFKILKDLSNIQLSNCGNINKLDIYSGFGTGSNIFKAMSQLQTFTLDNSLGMKDIQFKGFAKLRTLVMRNMLELENIGFDDMIDRDSIATLYNVTFTNCPLIDELSMNISSDLYAIRFADGATLDISGLTSLKTFKTNYQIKGLRKMILPIQMNNLVFDDMYGDGDSDIKSLWSVDAVGDHLNDDYLGVDFKHMDIHSINMAGLTAIKNGLNFHIKPTEQHPNLNKNRDGGVLRPWFRPEGSIDLTEYINEVDGMFKGLDLSKMDIMINNPSMFQTNLDEIFSNTILPDVGIVNNVLTKFPKATSMNKLMNNASPISSIKDIKLPTNNISLESAFSGCKQLIEDIAFPQTVINVTQAFRDCTGIKSIHENWDVNYRDPDMKYLNCYMNCKNIETIGESEGTLADVPRDWGGYGFDKEVTMLAEINTAKAGSRTIRISDYESDTVHLYTDWGDGTIDDLMYHTYARDGIYNIKTQRLSTMGYPFTKQFKESLIRVSQIPKRLITVESLFSGCVNLISARLDLNDDVPSISGLFDGCVSLETVYFNLPKNCMILNSLFKGCKNLQNIDFIGTWDTSKIISMRDTFNGCNSVSALDVSNWDVSKVTTFRSMFQDCTNVDFLDVGRWNTGSSTSMASMFTNCASITSIDVSTWNTSKVKELSNTFQGCTKLEYIDVSGWDTSSVTTMSFLFQRCENLLSANLSSWNVSNVTTIISLFQNCYRITNINVSGWNTNRVTTMAYTFNGCQALTSLNVSTWRMPLVNNASGMFASCYQLRTLMIGDWTVNRLLNTNTMFQGCAALTSLDVSRLSVDSVTNASTMFQGCNSLEELDVSNWNTSSITNMSSMFSGCMRLEQLDLSAWDVSMVTDMSYMFYECQMLSDLNIKGWQTDNLLRMYSMFQNCNKMTVFDISNWDVSRVEDLNCLFQNCSSLVNIDLSKWDTSSVTELTSVFQNCISLKSAIIGNWNTKNVRGLSYGFYNCKNIQRLDLSGWDIENANDSSSLYYTFLSCDSLSDLIPPKNINSNITIPNQGSRDNLVMVLNNLKDRSSSSSLKLTLGATNLAKLTPEDIQIATDKNWSVV